MQASEEQIELSGQLQLLQSEYSMVDGFVVGSEESYRRMPESHDEASAGFVSVELGCDGRVDTLEFA